MLGQRLKMLRTKKKITQAELAEKIGLTRGTYAHYEIDKRQPDYETLQKLADFFEVTTDYLLGRNELVSQYTSLRNEKELTDKDEKDIAKRMKKIREDLQNADGGLSFHGEPMSEEAMESLLEALEYAERTATKINKKYIPKKYRED